MTIPLPSNTEDIVEVFQLVALEAHPSTNFGAECASPGVPPVNEETAARNTFNLTTPDLVRTTLFKNEWFSIQSSSFFLFVMLK